MYGSTSLRTGVPMIEASQTDLVVLAQRGDLQALGALYDTNYPVIYRYIRARVGDSQLAEDLTGDVFRRMLTGLPQFRPMGLPFRAWLFRIAHNVVADNYREERRHMSVDLQETEYESKKDDDPASVVEQKLTMEEAHKALGELDASQRDVLMLRFLSGLSLQEVAHALNRTEDSVKALQRRGLAALRVNVAQE